ncbi:MAG TPA: hypothetical protein VND91_08340 [Candidatus Saccharimonadia bacterium]|nr:hypothetical protein [Candidatus Saccharimonadia bacterium]
MVRSPLVFVVLLAVCVFPSAAQSSDLVFTSGFEDDEVCSTGCPPDGWRVREWPLAVSYASCSTVRVFGIAPGDAFMFTTCVPPGVQAGTGDPVITSIVDSNGRSYPASNDDCTVSETLPQLRGWDCRNTAGVTTMACAPAERGGFAVQDAPHRLDVTICPFGAAGAGTSKFHVWWNGTSNPNPG